MAKQQSLTRRAFVGRTAAGAAAGMAFLASGRTQAAQRVDGCTEKQEYKDEETGARVIRLTNNSKYNDEHNYNDTSPWSPDGGKIIFSSAPAVKDGGWPHGTIFMMDADGTNIRKLADAPGICSSNESNRPIWAADGKSVYFLTYDVRRMHSISLLRRAFLDSGEVQSVGNFFLWHVSEATGRLTYTNPNGLYSTAPDGSDCQLLASIEQVQAVSPTRSTHGILQMQLWHSKWNADGSKCLVVLVGLQWNGRKARERVKEFCIVNADGSDLHFCTRFSNHPIWHPTEDRILCNMPEGMCLMDANGKGKQKITYFGKGHPSYSPDGSIICTDWPGSGKGCGYVYLIDPRTGKPSKLCRVPFMEEHKPVSGSCHPHPAWSRDGRSIIFDSNQSGTSQLYQVFIS